MKEHYSEKMNHNLVLIGFMGSGKTSIGLKLSYRLKRAFEDTDKIIEKREGRSISEIFAVDGEAYFRKKETDLLKELAGSLHNRILSVGGGTPVREENRVLLGQIGVVVYLRIRPETVYDRLKEDDTRPLLQGENPLLKITRLLEERKNIYEETADIVIDVDGLDMEEVVGAILNQYPAGKESKQ